MLIYMNKITTKFACFLGVSLLGGLLLGWSRKGETIPLQAQDKLQDMTRNSKLLHPDKPPTYYISCADNDKSRIESSISLLKQEGIACVLSGELEPGVDALSSTKSALAQADKCLIIVSDTYLKEIEKPNSNVSREYRLMRNELKDSPESSKFVPIWLVEPSSDIPGCLRDRQGISFVASEVKWQGKRLLNYSLLLINQYYKVSK